MVFPTHIPLQKCSWGLQLTPELLLVTDEALAAEELTGLPEVLLELVVAPEVVDAFDVLPLPSAVTPAPPTPAADSSSPDPVAQAEAMTTHAEAIKNPSVHPVRPFVLRRLLAMLMSP